MDGEKEPASPGPIAPDPSSLCAEGGWLSTRCPRLLVAAVDSRVQLIGGAKEVRGSEEGGARLFCLLHPLPWHVSSSSCPGWQRGGFQAVRPRVSPVSHRWPCVLPLWHHPLQPARGRGFLLLLISELLSGPHFGFSAFLFLWIMTSLHSRL